MKRTLKIFGFSIMMFVFLQSVNAASISVTSNVNTATSGGKVTFYVNIQGAGSWQLTGKGTGATSGCSLGDQGTGDSGSGKNINKTLSVTCNATNVGQISFAVSGNISSVDNNGNIRSQDVSARKIVVVQAPREKDTNNYLKSLGVKDYNISPSFSKDTLEYSVDVPSTVNKVVIEALPESGYANVRGTGEVEVEEGTNTFDVVVTSETGVERTYKLLIHVKDENPIHVSYHDKEYTVIKNVKNINIPESYETTTIKMNEIDVPAFVSDITGFTLIAAKDDSGKTYFFIYDADNNSYQQYNEQKSANMVIYIMEPEHDLANYVKTAIDINGESYLAFQVNEDSPYAIVYGMNVETGKKDFYVYDFDDNVFQKYYDDIIVDLQKKEQLYGRIILVGACGLILLFALCIFAFFRKPSKKKMKKYLERMKQKEPISSTKDVTDTNSRSKKKTSSKKEKKKKEHHDESKEMDESDENLDVSNALEKLSNAEEIILEHQKTMSINPDDFEQL